MYVSRSSKGTRYTYEERLQQSLAIDGYLTYIVGMSNVGKTVLCENVIGQANMIFMSGNDFPKENDFWSGIGRKVGLSMAAEISEERNYFAVKDKVITFFKENKKVLVLDEKSRTIHERSAKTAVCIAGWNEKRYIQPDFKGTGR